MIRLFLITLLVTLSACQRPPMVLPTMFASGQVAPIADTPDPWRTSERTIFYATDRQFEKEQGPMGAYGTRRDDSLSLGQLEIGIGNQDAWQRFNAATQAKPTGERPVPTITAIHRLGSMQWTPAGITPHVTDAPSEQAFIKQLDTALQQSSGKTITIFLNGFNTSFEEAALTTAELSLYSGGLGPYILYSWPSLNSLFEYSHDRDSVRYTTAHARRFVEMLAEEIDSGHLSATKINFVAHSTGAEVVGSVLRELGLMSFGRTPEQRKAQWKIGDVILVAPDISTDVARERILKEDLRGMYEKIVVYSSEGDTALHWASRFLYRTKRIGSIREQELTEVDRRWLGQAENVTLISVDTQHNGDPVQHSHHRYSGAALSDILLCLRSDLPPAERGLIRKDGEIIWHFAKDYEALVTEAAIKAYGKPSAE